MKSNCIYLRDVSLGDVRMDDVESENLYWKNLSFYKDMMRGKSFHFTSPVTFFVGENGCGKSTLIEAIAVAMGYNAEGGSKNFNFNTRSSTSMLFHEIKLARIAYEKDGFFLRAESFYNVATNIEDLRLNKDTYGGKSLHEQSHGESFLALIQNRFWGNGFYILDEPEAALSPTRLLTLLIEIDNLVSRNSQFIIATHSPILLAYPNAQIYNLDFGIENINYMNTDHYKITKNFLDNPDTFVKKLLKNNLNNDIG